MRPMAVVMRRWLTSALTWFAVRSVTMAVLMIMTVAVILPVVLGRIL